jgi:type I restriction enzyme S subunit
VLTLSAVTGGRFDPEQSKNAVFDREPDESQLAMDGTFLICRGNGNLDLVGRAQVAAGAPTGTAFPDTVIACRADPNRVVNSYLLAVWSTRAVRSQIESGARTTNGTHKVNQNLLGSVVIPVPPMDLQRRFAEVAERLAEAHAASSRARSGAERLFESLLYRTFTLGAEAADAS